LAVYARPSGSERPTAALGSVFGLEGGLNWVIRKRWHAAGEALHPAGGTFHLPSAGTACYRYRRKPTDSGVPLSLRKREFVAGVRDTLPLMLGAFPFGLIYGAVAATSGLSTAAAMAMSALVFAGASQFIAVGLVAVQTPVAIIVLTTLIVNLRHMLYSATLLPYLKNLSQTWRIPLAFWLTDETFAVTVHRFQQEDGSAEKHWYQLGSSVAMYLNWQFWCWSGLVLGQKIPDASEWGLDVAMPITFIGMINPFVKTVPVAVCIFAAGAASLLTWTLPYKLGIVVSAFAGIAAGLVTERRLKKTKGAVPK
jgi:4-azaleucine resistance transporter AzlC